MIRRLLSGAGGSGAESVRRWWYQRLSAVALVPLTLWFIYELATLDSLDYAVVRAWLAAPSTAILFILLAPTLFYHALLGMQEVIEDYVANERHKDAAITLARFIAALGAFASILAVMAVTMGI